ncbi:copper chaperone PCu(A)C [Mangrovicoccus algicola]|uniref:Copper chaperone PCu(A)C n=1 Tax=Mangrovicoccus algicola TaxID=2771008 RepID=A0A8J6Z909_9RHOB|nr:copper chaperone PCu(A)C [Mangrovicoccus algicola]MBE3640209.1 copper chaperone PCu(A)C [Mangrovicoccus algicola]
MTRFLLAALLALSAPAMAAADHEHEHEHEAHEHDDGHDHAVDEEHHAFAIGDFAVEHAWTRATGADTADVFMMVHNMGEEPVMISGARAEIAESAGLVGFRIAGGEETAEALPPLPVPAGREMEMAPGVMAVRLSGLSEALVEGGHLDLTLLTGAGSLAIEAEIGAANATHHSHAGHSHLHEDDHDHDDHEHGEEDHGHESH